MSGFCLSLGWRPGNPAIDVELDRLSNQYGVSGGDARILILRQLADAGESLKAEFPVDAGRPPDQATRLAFLDQVDAFARRSCSELKTTYPDLFSGDVASNQALVDARIAAVRQQELARP